MIKIYRFAAKLLSSLYCFALCLITLPSFAYGPCDEDVQKLCKSETHVETERTCLHKKIGQLSPDCKSFVQSKESDWKKMVASWELVKDSCRLDIVQFCNEVKIKPEEPIKEMQVCLMMTSEKISAACKQDMNRHIKEYLPNILELK